MIMVTGGLGFIGVHIGHYLAEQGEEVLLTRHRTSHIPALLADHVGKKVKVAGSDILDLPNLIDLLDKNSVDGVIHSAVRVDGSLYQIAKANIEGTINILEAARLCDIKRVTFVSSGVVYYEQKSDEPYRETEPVTISSRMEVSATKKAGEIMTLFYGNSYGLDVAIVRPTRVYGPYYKSGRNPVMAMVEGAVAKKPVILPQAHEDAKVDFVYVKDVARATGLVYLAKERKNQIYNVGGGASFSYRHVAEIIKKLIPGAKIELGRGERTEFDPAYVDLTRIHNDVGYWPEYDLERGIGEWIDWIKKGKP